MNDDFRPPRWTDGRAGGRIWRGKLADRARLIAALEDEGMKCPADAAEIDRLGRALCEVEDALGVASPVEARRVYNETGRMPEEER